MSGTGPDRLARAYRRLLWAYPRYYRRVRGLEMLTTLLDAAPPGRRRPSARDVLDIVGGGLRCRLRVPRVVSYRIVAAVAALIGAAAGAWATGLAGWHTGASLPTRAEVVAVAAAAVPDAGLWMPTRYKTCDHTCWPNPSDALITYGDPFQADDTVPSLKDTDRPRTADPAANRVYLPLALPHAQMAAVVEGAHDRLAAAGWRVGPLRARADTRGFWAAKGELTVRVEGRGPTQRDAPAVALTVHHDAPWATLPAAAGGAVAGLFAGWWAAAFAIRRYVGQGRLVRNAMVVVGAPALTVAGFTAWSLPLGVAGAVHGSGSGVAQSVLLGTPVMVSQPLTVAAGCLVVCLVLGLAPARPAPYRSPEPA